MALTLLRDVTDWVNGAPVVAVPAGTVSYAGAVLKTFSRTERVMSDVYDDVSYADVWDGNDVKTLSTGVMGYNTYAVTVDATPDVVDAANAFVLAKTVAKAKRDLDDRIAKAKDKAAEVGRGKSVKVVKGRKVPLGTEGNVFWTGPNKFSRYGELRIGFKDAAGATHWTAAGNVEVTNAADFFNAADYDASGRDFEADAIRDLDAATKNNYGYGWYALARDAVSGSGIVKRIAA